jgi:hypothetical protein
MGNLDLIILTVIVSFLYIGFGCTLFLVQNRQQQNEDKKKGTR